MENVYQIMTPRFRRLVPALMAGLLISCGGGGGSGGASGGGSLTGAHLPSTQEVDNAPAPLSFDSGPLPAKVDLSSSKALPPVRKQSLQDCIAFAFGYALASFEVATSVNQNADQLSHQASPSDLYAKLLVKEKEACNSGTTASVALDILVHEGVQSLALAPYVPDQCVNPSLSGTFGIAGYHWIKPSDTDSIKQVLADGHPVGMAISLYDGMNSWGETHHDDSVFVETGNPSAVNGHGMLIVGYDDAKQAWKVMNSWGPAWGKGGLFWMSYGTFAASARVCYAVDGGGTAVSLDPGTPVVFLNFKALQYDSKKYPIKYLVTPFQFDHAAHILQIRMITEGTGVATPWQTINQWLTKSYFWWASSNDFPAGRYSLELKCETSLRKPYTLKQTATLAFGGYTRATGAHGNAEASPRVIAPLLAEGSTRFARGGKIMDNGHIIQLEP